MLSAAQAGAVSAQAAASGCTAGKSVLTSKQKITICQSTAGKHLLRHQTCSQAAEFCTPVHFQTSLKESHLDCAQRYLSIYIYVYIYILYDHLNSEFSRAWVIQNAGICKRKTTEMA